MKLRPTKTTRSRSAVCAAILAICTLGAFGTIGSAAFAADDNTTQSAQARYEKDRAACIGGKTHQDRATCLKEAGAALESSKRGALADTSPQYRKNALQRCEKLPEKDRADCRARIDGDSTTTSGDALDGGILRERVTRDPAPAPANP